jgi:hypothetical protein
MPYIYKYCRPSLDAAVREAHLALTIEGAVPGNLNYLLTKIILEYLNFESVAQPNYTDYNEVIGVLECMKQEIYRRLIAPYEDAKLLTNGDVFP